MIIARTIYTGVKGEVDLSELINRNKNRREDKQATFDK